MKNFERSTRTPVRIPSKTSFGKPLCRRRGAASAEPRVAATARLVSRKVLRESFIGMVRLVADVTFRLRKDTSESHSVPA